MSTTRNEKTGDGTRLLVRHWEAESPWAAMLIVHGLGEHSGRYEATGTDFAAAGIDTESFDLRGFGQSDGARAFVAGWDEYLNDVEVRLAARAELGLPVVLLGHSLGGLIAFTYAVSDRRRPDLLVLSAPALDADLPQAKRIAAKVLSRFLPKVSLPNDIEGHQLSSDPAVGEAYFADPLVYTKTTARLGAELLGAMEAAQAGIGRLDVPALVIHGGADTVVPPTASAPLGERPGVHRVLFPGFRHESFNEPKRAEAIDTVVNWLKERVTPA